MYVNIIFGMIAMFTLMSEASEGKSITTCRKYFHKLQKRSVEGYTFLEGYTVAPDDEERGDGCQVYDISPPTPTPHPLSPGNTEQNGIPDPAAITKPPMTTAAITDTQTANTPRRPGLPLPPGSWVFHPNPVVVYLPNHSISSNANLPAKGGAPSSQLPQIFIQPASSPQGNSQKREGIAPVVVYGTPLRPISQMTNLYAALREYANAVGQRNPSLVVLKPVRLIQLPNTSSFRAVLGKLPAQKAQGGSASSNAATTPAGQPRVQSTGPQLASGSQSASKTTNMRIIQV